MLVGRLIAALFSGNVGQYSRDYCIIVIFQVFLCLLF